ncbi:MAG: bifunctional pyr operon transcriptional regulator/uracil phosphoribosyltransferase PyrR [Planctomycetota bacterium]
MTDAASVETAIAAMASAMREAHAGGPVNVLGIVTRGETLAGRLRKRLADDGLDVRGGSIDVTLYRDDLREIGPNAIVGETDLPGDIDGVPTWLVDDVIHTGRSVRAAMQALVDFGRPAWVKLAVLVDRNGRELPIQPDVVGLSLSPDVGSRVNVRFTETDGHDGVEVSA